MSRIISARARLALEMLVEHATWELSTLHFQRDGKAGDVFTAHVVDRHAGDIGRIQKLTVPTPTFRVMLREQLLKPVERHSCGFTHNGKGEVIEETISTSYRPSWAGEIVGNRKPEVAS